MFTTEMIRLFAVVLERDNEVVTETLLREGVIQFINVSNIEGETGEKLDDVKRQSLVNDLIELRRSIEGLLHPLKIYPDHPKEIDLENRSPIDISAERKKLSEIAKKRETFRERQRLLQQEILKLEDIKRQVDLYGLKFSNVKLSSQHSFITMQIGIVAAEKRDEMERSMKELPSVVLPIGNEEGMEHLLLISMKRDARTVEEILHKVGWHPVELPKEMQTIKSSIAQDLTKKIDKLTENQKALSDSAKELVVKEVERLKEVWVSIRVNELFYAVQNYFMRSSRTMIFSGWLPIAKQERIEKKLLAVTDNRCYLEWLSAQESKGQEHEIPVQFTNPKVFKPFQMLVKNFGVPQYGTIDPTPFVMPLYLIMFGLMFADVGQGIVLSLLGFGLSKIMAKKKDSEGVLTFLSLITWCGFSSAFFGLLFGSYFGAPWFDALWFDFHGIVAGHGSEASMISNIYDILAITIFFGIAVIVMGLLFNWINLIKQRKWLELLFDKGGILGGWMYGGGVYVGSYMISHDYSFPNATIMTLLFGIPAALLILKEPLHLLLHPESLSGKGNVFAAFCAKLPGMIMEWGVELLEIFSGYLSNTLSFMRVAGLGIAHVSLMVAFFTMAEMAGGRGIGPILILILGNILVICLEGLSAGIQALRLNYYEFFTKFFHGTGKLYAPVSLDSRDY